MPERPKAPPDLTPMTAPDALRNFFMMCTANRDRDDSEPPTPIDIGELAQLAAYLQIFFHEYPEALRDSGFTVRDVMPILLRVSHSIGDLSEQDLQTLSIVKDWVYARCDPGIAIKRKRGLAGSTLDTKPKAAKPESASSTPKAESATPPAGTQAAPVGAKEQATREAIGGAPDEVRTSLQSFLKDHPDKTKNAFLMMRFEKSDAHDQILNAVKDCLEKYGLKALRADHKEYNNNLLSNVKTYAHGCSFGIAVFERITKDEHNPNIALEVGYMMALKKPICFLKDKNLQAMQSDLVGELYRPFDPQKIAETILPEVSKWLKDKGIISLLLVVLGTFTKLS